MPDAGIKLDPNCEEIYLNNIRIDYVGKSTKCTNKLYSFPKNPNCLYFLWIKMIWQTYENRTHVI